MNTLIFLLSIYLAGRESLYVNVSKTNYNNPIHYYKYHSVYTNALVALGLYEYTYRDIYFTLFKYLKDNENEEEKKLSKKYERTYEENEYTGIFKDKNLIMILLESMDERILREEITPTIVRLRKESLDFQKRYSYVPTGGCTLCTEFTMVTGLYYNRYLKKEILNSTYNDSISGVFYKNGYLTSSMHENTGSYFDRAILHKNYQFENSYFLMDMSEDVIPYMDTQMVDKDEYYYKIIPHDTDKFMSLITTISAHGPYDGMNEHCQKDQSPLECFTMLAKRTDDFVDHLSAGPDHFADLFRID